MYLVGRIGGQTYQVTSIIYVDSRPHSLYKASSLILLVRVLKDTCERAVRRTTMVFDVAYSFFIKRLGFHLLLAESKNMPFSCEDIIRIVMMKWIVFVEEKEQILSTWHFRNHSFKKGWSKPSTFPTEQRIPSDRPVYWFGGLEYLLSRSRLEHE